MTAGFFSEDHQKEYESEESSSEDSDSGGEESDFEEFRRRKKLREKKRKQEKKKNEKVKLPTPKQKFGGTDEEVAAMIRKLNAMRLDDPEYAPVYYKVMVLDMTGTAEKCIKAPIIGNPAATTSGYAKAAPKMNTSSGEEGAATRSPIRDDVLSSHFYQSAPPKARIVEIYTDTDSSDEGQEDEDREDSSEDEESRGKKEKERVYLTLPKDALQTIIEPQVHQVKRTVPSTRVARKEVFNGVLMPGKDHPKERAGRDKRPAEKAITGSEGSVVPLPAAPMQPARLPSDLPEPVLVDARRVRFEQHPIRNLESSRHLEHDWPKEKRNESEKGSFEACSYNGCLNMLTLILAPATPHVKGLGSGNTSSRFDRIRTDTDDSIDGIKYRLEDSRTMFNYRKLAPKVCI
ncbi:hypothetical protein FB451DRAFT_1178286 [Mycena latifolia]|nr:hypothetical protein FB451DRAFT_1178286 [Mycena latifolia]